MSVCMETGKPPIAILMALYEPRLDWLREQLDSLNAQAYPNLRLYVRDDCSPSVPFGDIEALVRECVTAFPYVLERNEKNLGSNGTFERLTGEAEGEYFAYCDQDDVWLPEKLETLQKELEASGALLVCSDMYIIDGEGKRTADSITKIHRHHVFHSGEGLAVGLFLHNFVTGCTMLVRAEEAKAAIPFCPYMVHDHYLALWCAACGSIQSVRQQLISHRVHGGNQTGIMTGVHDKKSYREARIDLMANRLHWLREHLPVADAVRTALEERIEWAEARQGRFEGRRGAAKIVWKYRSFDPITSWFEIVGAGFPEKLFMLFIFVARKNWV